jgi:altronate dehydratase large subunit
VIPSVLCAAQAAQVMAQATPGAVAIEHQHGCSQLGGDAHLTEQILAGLGTHPNVAGTLVVSLGCETVQGILLHRAIEARGQRARFVGIQQAGGTLAAIEAGRAALAELRVAASADSDLPVSWRDLTVGIEGAWLSLPRPQATIFVRVIDRLLADGAAVIQAVPVPRGDGREGRIGTSPAFLDVPPFLSEGRDVRSVTITPYAQFIDRQMVKTSGSVGGAAGQRLLLMPTPATRIAQKTGLAAAGAHVILSPLVEGLPAGCPVAPVVHVGIAPSARPLAQDVEVMLDVEPRAEAEERLLETLAAACLDETITEALGTFEMAIHRIAPTM